MAIRSFDELPAALSVEDVSQALGISRSGSYNLTKRDDFPVLRIGRRLIVPKIAFLSWLDRQAEKNRVSQIGC